VSGFAPGDRVFGGALSRAVADFVVVDPTGGIAANEAHHTIAAQVDGITATNGANAAPGALEKLARLIATGRLRVPIAASFPVEQIRTAVERQAGRHVKGKVVIDL
jgi:zinc-binding alcohol dehydrogenase family protein